MKYVTLSMEVPALRHRFIALLRFVLPALCVAGAAQAQVPFKVGVAGGWTLPVEPSAVTDSWNGGMALGLSVHFRSGARLGGWAEVEYHRLGFDSGAFEASIAGPFPGVNTSGNDLYVVPLTAGIEYSLTGWGNTRPYVTAGLGYYWFEVTEAEASGPASDGVQFPDPSDDGFGVRGGLGVRTLVTPAITLFLDVSYHRAWASPDPIDLVPMRIGLRF
jgi:opacity protein-like surface antigen